MAEKDLVSKKIEDYNEVFADIYNTLLFRKSVIIPEQLQSGSTESIYKTIKMKGEKEVAQQCAK